jgi:GNAT superfamily N-acetyltransferase
LRNDLHNQPFGFMEDVYVAEEMHGQGLGASLVEKVIAMAKERGCYKLVATSRYPREKIHQLYIKLGFKDYGKEFRIDF